MRLRAWLAILTSCVPAALAAGQSGQPADPSPGEDSKTRTSDTDGVPASGEALRVGGTAESEVVQRGETYEAGEVGTDTPLPEGYPPPTAPGAIEVKTYPSVRRAEFHRDEAPNAMSGNIAFWPLFQHIKQREIEMTAPVEMDFPGLEPDPKSQPESWTMSFLYRRSDLGPTGEFGKVQVRDLPPLRVISLGFKGPYSMEWARIKLGELETWLGGQSDWVRDGEPRVLHYNGPDVPVNRRWGEVQIPVRPADEAGSGSSEDSVKE